MRAQVKLNEAWNAKVEHPTKPPTCSVAGAGLEPVESSRDWQLFNWKYSSASSSLISLLFSTMC